ncbi:MAG: carboxylating nicotinate-nucleotide diphosphorylase [Alphaproteobacteria bacterium]|nr:carboxylating nicotinate-nucleotide diphosphorylase [Alphaproteobacteria bacterium]
MDTITNKPTVPDSFAPPASLHAVLVEAAVRAAFHEDLGLAGDITSQATLAPDATAIVRMNLRERGIVCGLQLARSAFSLIGDGISFVAKIADGDTAQAGNEIATITGNARLIFSAERVALNFLAHMSGIATLTHQFVTRIEGTGAKICCTRKTTPGLRAFEKFAVRCGGGSNHRFGLYDGILIKDNHIAVAGGVAEALGAARTFAGHLVAIEIEVDTIDQLAQALEAGATIILLDNMDPNELSEAVRINGGRATLEASGEVTLDTVRAIAETGVDFISTSKITMGAVPLDIGLDMQVTG